MNFNEEISNNNKQYEQSTNQENQISSDISCFS